MTKLSACWSAILGCVLSASNLHACPIPITNAGFETDAITGGNAPIFMVRTAPPTGWSFLPGPTTSGGLIAPNAGPNTFYSTGATQGIEGQKVFFTIDGERLMRQVLTATLQANTTYTLSVASGTRSGWTVFGGYSIELGTATTGKTVLKWTAGGRNLAPLGHFATMERSFTTGPNPPGLGEPLQITIGQPATTLYSPPTVNAGYTELDNVKLSAVPAVVPHVANTPIDVFIVAGQSNAHGWGGNVAQLSAARMHYALEPSRNALLAYNEKNAPDLVESVGTFAQLRSQGSGFGGNFDGFGPELSMGTDLSRLYNKRVAIIKYTIGSLGLSNNFRKLNPLDTRPEYQVYGRMIAFINNAVQQLQAQGYTPTLKGFFWLQGEGEALSSNTGYGTAYGGNLGIFIGDIRADLGVPTLKFFTTQINPNTPKLLLTTPVNYVANTANVNAGMSTVAGSVSNVTYVTTSDITGWADDVHYNANGLIDIGRKWAAAYYTVAGP